MGQEEEIVPSTIAESENYLVWKADETDGEQTFHIELGLITLHFFEEEWDEFLSLMKGILKGG
jgi:hypothetical protein